jgi:DNA-binding NarL/FixJ family response regulator
MSAAIRVVAGSSDLLRLAGMTQAMRAAGIDVVAVAGNAGELVRKARAYHPGLAVIDREIEPGPGDPDGPVVVGELRSIDSGVGVLILSGDDDERYVLDVLGDEPRGFGFLVKARIRSLQDFTAAVQRVAGGGTVIDPVVLSRLAGRGSSDNWREELTARERQVLALMAEGRTNQFIAKTLVVTIPAIERHVTSIYAKLGLKSNGNDHRRVLAILRYVGG